MDDVLPLVIYSLVIADLGLAVSNISLLHEYVCAVGRFDCEDRVITGIEGGIQFLI
jgi:hypothetical protein